LFQKIIIILFSRLLSHIELATYFNKISGQELNEIGKKKSNAKNRTEILFT